MPSLPPLDIWPVIHLAEEALARENAAIASRCGCAGVFLISMDGRDERIGPMARELMQAHPGLRVGVNFLTLPAPEALSRAFALGVAATWVDKPGVRSDAIEPWAAGALASALAARPEHLFFGSVAFKYQRADADPPEASARALTLGMIPTTSGQATGSAPPAAKLAAIRARIGPEAPLGLASGLTPENAGELAPFLTHALVSTGISGAPDAFDEALLRRFVAACAR